MLSEMVEMLTVRFRHHLFVGNTIGKVKWTTKGSLAPTAVLRCVYSGAERRCALRCVVFTAIESNNQIRFISGNIWPIKTTKKTTKKLQKRQTDRH